MKLGESAESWAVLLSYALAVRLCSRADQRSPKPFISRDARRRRAGRHFDPYRIIISLLDQLGELYGIGDGGEEFSGRFVCADLCDPQRSFAGLGTYSHAITSPPYINAQDYFRNFKLEPLLVGGCFAL